MAHENAGRRKAIRDGERFPRVVANTLRCPPFRPVREANARTDSAFSRRVLIAAFHCDAPARCGAFVDTRRIVAATWAVECGRETLTQSLGQWGSADSFDLVREAGQVQFRMA